MTDKNAIWKWLILVLAITGSLIFVTPPKDKITLGIDLAGGTSFTVEMDEAQVIESVRSDMPDASAGDLEAERKRRMSGAQERALEVIRNRVDSTGTSEPIIYPYKDNRIIVQLPRASDEEVQRAEEMISSAAFLEFRAVHKDNAKLTDELLQARLAPPGFEVVDSSSGLLFRRTKDYDEEKQKPGFQARVSRFHAPDSAHSLLMEKETVDGVTLYRPCFVDRRAPVTGSNLKDASVDFGALNDPVVNIRFDTKGAAKFKNVTKDLAPGGRLNPGMDTYRQLAIVLDGTLYSAPRINEAISGGRAQIEGRFTNDEAHFLANVLKAGSLPVPVKIVEKRQVEASLGKASVESGVRAIIYGGIAVLIFMMAYYLSSGVIANLALLLNIVLLPLGMVIAAGFLGIFATDAVTRGRVSLPVLTLPGIAGILLTIGMAVDANVLIFERIREENRAGKSFWNAINAGYDRAFVTILDANLTTLLIGIILFIFGSGPIRGFAVTLCAGIIMSMFTALVVTKLFYGVAASVFKMKTLKMVSFFKDTSFDFIAKRKMAVVFSVVVITVTWAIMVTQGLQRPSQIFGVDFTGGSALIFSYDTKLPNAELRGALEKKGIVSPMIQYQEALQGGGGARLQIIVSSEAAQGAKPSELVRSVLAQDYAANGFKLLQEDDVDGQVGKELTRRAILAIVISMIGIIIYISWRFELGFALGAIVALIHDVLFTVGLYTLFGRQLSLPIVAALLTIVGYSVNDTIIIFDRIREDLRLMRNNTFREICNISINQTLSRTLLTSGTTLIMVVMLLIVGGGAINDFALALLIGIIAGTYSTVYVATPVVLLWYKEKRPDFGEAK
ncbi:MAG: protein translocase subunit SecD [Verrucomicrobia bacterium]|nr:protein translocase subunit SecD [Verrucomicrobiota bacterium]